MRKVLAAIATVGFFAVAAYAGEVEGAEQNVGETTRIILLEDGIALGTNDSADLASAQTGQGDMRP